MDSFKKTNGMSIPWVEYASIKVFPAFFLYPSEVSNQPSTSKINNPQRVVIFATLEVSPDKGTTGKCMKFSNFRFLTPSN